MRRGTSLKKFPFCCFLACGGGSIRPCCRDELCIHLAHLEHGLAIERTGCLTLSKFLAGKRVTPPIAFTRTSCGASNSRKRDSQSSPVKSRARGPDSFKDTADCSQGMETSNLRTGQNEIKRYKEKHVESTVPLSGMLRAQTARRGQNSDAASRLFEKQCCVGSGC